MNFHEAKISSKKVKITLFVEAALVLVYLSTETVCGAEFSPPDPLKVVLKDEEPCRI